MITIGWQRWLEGAAVETEQTNAIDVAIAAVHDAMGPVTAPTTRALKALLHSERDRQVWAGQVGPAYTRDQVADLLDISTQAVAQRARNHTLLELVQDDDRRVYPAVQFGGHTPLTGLSEVLKMLLPVVATPWTVASWLTVTRHEWDERTACELLAGDGTERAEVLEAARRTARRLAA
jgi:hypothetical protein